MHPRPGSHGEGKESVDYVNLLVFAPISVLLILLGVAALIILGFQIL